MTDQLNLRSYLPTLVAQYLARQSAVPTPSSETLTGTILFADISGWSALSEQMAAQGAIGIEELNHTLNAYFGALISTITAYGGDVAKFAGDALLAFWDGAADPAAAAGAAAACGQEIQAVMARQHGVSTALTIKVVLGSGAVDVLYLGGVNQRIEYVYTGEPLLQVSLGAMLAHSGDVIVSPETWALIQPHAEAERLRAGTMRLTRISAQPLPPLRIPTPDPAIVRQFIPQAVLNFADVGLDGWLAELRVISALFIALPISHWTPLETDQDAFTTIQTALNEVEGTINKVSVDEKGVVVVAALGLPPQAHEDDPLRAVEAALLLAQSLEALGLDYGIGITTGRVFCGTVGSEQRREYTIIGDSVNLAARLMAEARNRILCDSATYEAARTAIRFEILPPVQVKGKHDAQPVFQPVAFGPATQAVAPGELVGRTAERIAFAEALAELAAGQSSLLLLEGPGGIGKTRLAQTLLSDVPEPLALTLFGAASMHDSGVLYVAWRTLLPALLDLGDQPPARRVELVRTSLTRLPDADDLLPLLNDLLGLELAETPRTLQLNGQFRAEQLRALVIALLESVRVRRPLVLTFDDANWLDSASWRLLEAVLAADIPCLVILTARVEPESPHWAALRDRYPLRHLPLHPLAPEDVARLIAQTLGVPEVPAEVVALINHHAEGQPFWSREIAIALRDSGVLQITGRGCRLAEHITSLEAVEIPATLQGVVTSRIDRLTTGQQLLLKAASVIGRAFMLPVLASIYPLPITLSALHAEIDTLSSLDITEPSSLEAEYSFRHPITHDVIYNLLPYTQRQRLHSAVADWVLEHGAATNASAAQLSRHWLAAGAISKATMAMDQAALYALHSGAYEEASAFLLEVQQLIKTHNLPTTPLEAARRERLLGEAWLGLGAVQRSRQHLEQALRLLDLPVPAGRLQFSLDLATQLRHQLRQRRRSQPVLPIEPPIAREAAQTCYLLWNIYNGANAAAQAWSMAWRMLNLAEVCGPSPELTAACALICLVTQTTPRVARFYERRTLKLLPAVRDPAARSRALVPLGRFYAYSGRWPQARALLGEARGLASSLGDRRMAEEVLGDLGMAEFSAGLFDHGIDLGEAVVASARERKSTHNASLGWYVIALNLVPLGHTETAIAYLEAALDHLREHPSTLYSLTSWGLLALAHWRAGNLVASEQAVAAVIEIAADSAPLDVVGFGFPGAAEVVLERLAFDTSLSTSSRRRLRQQASVLLRNVRRARWLVPIFKPLALRCAGLLALVQGRPAQAALIWQRGLLAAQALSMPYEQALLLLLLSRVAAPDDAVVFQRLGRRILAELHAADPPGFFTAPQRA